MELGVTFNSLRRETVDGHSVSEPLDPLIFKLRTGIVIYYHLCFILNIIEINSKRVGAEIKPNKFYSKKLFSLAKKIAKKNGIYLEEGIYCWTFGPMYETPSEIKYLQSLNGTSVGMSTVPEVLEGGELGLNLLTITMLTNFAAGISGSPLTHDEVLYNAERGKNKFIKLVSGIIERI